MSAKLSVSTSFWVANLRNTDGTALIGDVSFCVKKYEPHPAHRCVLAASSPFFARKFQSWTSEEDKRAVVQFSEKEVSDTTLGELLDVLYGLEIDLSFENVFYLHAASDFLSIEPIARECLSFMNQKLSCETFVSVWGYAKGEFAGAKDLAAACLAFLPANFEKLSDRESFLGLDFEDVSAFLSAMGVKQGSANTNLNFLLGWLNHGWKTRSAYTEKSVSLIVWENVDYSTLEHMETFRVFRARECESNKERASAYHLLKNLLGPSTKNDESAGESKVYCLKQSGEGAGYTCEVFSGPPFHCSSQATLAYIGDREFEILHSFEFADRPCLLINVRGTLKAHTFQHDRILEPFAELVLPDWFEFDVGEKLTIAAGENGWLCLLGLDDDNALASLIIYDLAVCEVTGPCNVLIADYMKERFAKDSVVFSQIKFTAVVVQEFLVLFGGYKVSAGEYGHEMKIFDMKEKEWRAGVNMLHYGTRFSAAALGPMLYISGGRFRGKALTSVYQLNVPAMRWSFLPALVEPRFGHHLVVSGRGLICFGGQSGKDEPRCDEAEYLQLDRLSKGWVLETHFGTVHPDFVVSL